MLLISIVKRITIQPHQEIAYELNNQLFILILELTCFKQMQIHILDEQDVDSEVSQYIVALLDNQCAYYKIRLEQINQNLSLIILEAHRKEDRANFKGLHFHPWYFFYSFELSTRRIKLVYATKSHGQQTLQFPLFFELNQYRTLIITDLSNILQIKQRILERVEEYTFAHENGHNPLFVYKKTRSRCWSMISQLVQDKKYKQTILIFYIKANAKLELKITDHEKEQVNKDVIKSSKRISTFQGRIFRMKPYLKIVRILETTKNELIEKTPYLLQYGRSNKTGVLQDTILKITNAEVVAKLGNSHTMISRNQLIARHIYGGNLEIIKIPQE